MRTAALLFLVSLSACPTVSDDLPGYLCQVTVEELQDGCAPRRTTGAGGVQWLGVREDGGLAFTVADQVKYGPTRSGEVLIGVSRDQVPPLDGGIVQLGPEAACRGLLGGWIALDGGLQLNQQWPGLDVCPGAPVYAPQTSCVAVRQLIFTPIRECPQRCVVLAGDGADCDC
ncbi:MAG: hypothetical protein AMXMBFR34_23660 [Myxococcaceae bacterium]